MSLIHRILIVAILSMLGASRLFAQFELTLIEGADDVLPGIPPTVVLEVRNTSSKPQRVDIYAVKIRVEGVNAPDGVPAAALGRSARLPMNASQRRSSSRPRPFQTLPAGWSYQARLSLDTPVAGDYLFRTSFAYHRAGRVYRGESWKGEVKGPNIAVRVRKPEGREADAFWCWRARRAQASIPPPRRKNIPNIWDLEAPAGKKVVDPSEFFSKFSDSTYAAYEIYKAHTGRWEGSADFYDRYTTSEYFRRLKDYGACDSEGNPNPKLEKWPELKGVSYLECRDNWFRIALEKHPKIWFADEMRLVVAGDAYLLGDKDHCRKMLEDLVKKARPYVAMKAGKLLRDMQAKNMLPGGPKELGAAPAPAQPEGKAVQ